MEYLIEIKLNPIFFSLYIWWGALAARSFFISKDVYIGHKTSVSKRTPSYNWNNLIIEQVVCIEKTWI